MVGLYPTGSLEWRHVRNADVIEGDLVEAHKFYLQYSIKINTIAPLRFARLLIYFIQFNWNQTVYYQRNLFCCVNMNKDVSNYIVMPKEKG